MKSFEFKLKAKAQDPQNSVRVIGIWLKVKEQIQDMFPNVECTPHYRELERYGMKQFWQDDWITRLHSLRSIERLPNRIQQRLGAVILFLLWKLWPKVCGGKPFDEHPLIVINQAMDRFHEKKWFALGYACPCTGSVALMGQIDIIVHDRKAANPIESWAASWVKRTY